MRVLPLIILCLVLLGCGGYTGPMSPYYEDAKVICYKDWASGSVSCVNK